MNKELYKICGFPPPTISYTYRQIPMNITILSDRGFIRRRVEEHETIADIASSASIGLGHTGGDITYLLLKGEILPDEATIKETDILDHSTLELIHIGTNV